MTGDGTAPSRTAVVVIGMHRSGTSALAGALSTLGLAVPRDLMPPQADNPRGFYEPVGVAALNDRILAELGASWDQPTIISPAAGRRLGDTYLADAMGALRKSFDGAPAVVLKDPRISLLQPLWDRALRAAGYAPRYVLIHRNPLDVAASLEARNGLTRRHAFRLWLAYVLAALDVERDARLSAVVGYEELLELPRFLLAGIAAGAGLRPADPELDAAAALLDASERHQRSTKHAFDASASIPDLLKEAWWLLRRWHSRPDADRRLAIANARAAFGQLALLADGVTRVD